MSLFNWLRRAPKPLNPNDYDLRHFNWVVWSDAWDGRSVPSDGGFNRALFYRDEKVYTHRSYRDHGARELSESTGNEGFLFIERLGQIYLALAKTSNRLGLHSPGRSGTTVNVLAPEKEKQALQRHWQYQNLQEQLIGMGWTVSFVPYEETPDRFMAKFEPAET